MKKYLKYIAMLIAAFTIAFVACEKPENVIPVPQTDTTKISNETTSQFSNLDRTKDESTTGEADVNSEDVKEAESFNKYLQSQPIKSSQQTFKIKSTPTYTGMYLNQFSSVLGDTAKENTLLRYHQKYKINNVSIYGLYSILGNSANYTKLSTFIYKARTQYGIVGITAVMGDLNGVTSLVNNYNNSQTDNNKKFTAVNLELEWWNNVTTWSNYYSILSSYRTWAQSKNPKLITETYIGWFKNPTGQDSIQAAGLVSKCDRILVHDYRTSPDFGYMKTRLDWIGRAAKAQGKIQNVVVIFSAEPGFMGPYLSTNDYATAYASIVSQYNAASFTGKDYINIIGWQVFCWSYAIQYRPN